jgi:hypothetical protein
VVNTAAIMVRPPATEPAPTPATAAALNDAIRDRGAVTFRSWDGNWIGMDADTDLTFLPGGVVHLFEYGFGISSYRGTYAITDRGDVAAQVPKFGHPWPAMTLRHDARSLLLLPKQSADDDVVMGNRGGATVTPGQGSYWPFRPVTPAEERELRIRVPDGN